MTGEVMQGLWWVAVKTFGPRGMRRVYVVRGVCVVVCVCACVVCVCVSLCVFCVIWSGELGTVRALKFEYCLKDLKHAWSEKTS